MLGFTSDVLVSKIDGTKSEKFDATYAAILALKADSRCCGLNYRQQKDILRHIVN